MRGFIQFIIDDLAKYTYDPWLSRSFGSLNRPPPPPEPIKPKKHWVQKNDWKQREKGRRR